MEHISRTHSAQKSYSAPAPTSPASIRRNDTLLDHIIKVYASAHGDVQPRKHTAEEFMRSRHASAQHFGLYSVCSAAELGRPLLRSNIHPPTSHESQAQDQRNGPALFTQYAQGAQQQGHAVHVSHERDTGAGLFRQYAQEAHQQGRAVHVSHAQDTGTALFRHYAQEAQQQGRAVHVSHERDTGTALFREYAQEAQQQGRAVHVSHAPEPQMVSIAVDGDGDGYADCILTGVDRNADGIPDAIQSKVHAWMKRTVSPPQRASRVDFSSVSSYPVTGRSSSVPRARALRKTHILTVSCL